MQNMQHQANNVLPQQDSQEEVQELDSRHWVVMLFKSSLWKAKIKDSRRNRFSIITKESQQHAPPDEEDISFQHFSSNQEAKAALQEEIQAKIDLNWALIDARFVSRKSKLVQESFDKGNSKSQVFDSKRQNGNQGYCVQDKENNEVNNEVDTNDKGDDNVFGNGDKMINCQEDQEDEQGLQYDDKEETRSQFQLRNYQTRSARKESVIKVEDLIEQHGGRVGQIEKRILTKRVMQNLTQVDSLEEAYSQISEIEEEPEAIGSQASQNENELVREEDKMIEEKLDRLLELVLKPSLDKDQLSQKAEDEDHQVLKEIHHDHNSRDNKIVASDKDKTNERDDKCQIMKVSISKDQISKELLLQAHMIQNKDLNLKVNNGQIEQVQDIQNDQEVNELEADDQDKQQNEGSQIIGDQQNQSLTVTQIQPLVFIAGNDDLNKDVSQCDEVAQNKDKVVVTSPFQKRGQSSCNSIKDQSQNQLQLQQANKEEAQLKNQTEVQEKEKGQIFQTPKPANQAPSQFYNTNSQQKLSSALQSQPQQNRLLQKKSLTYQSSANSFKNSYKNSLKNSQNSQKNSQNSNQRLINSSEQLKASLQKLSLSPHNQSPDSIFLTQEELSLVLHQGENNETSQEKPLSYKGEFLELQSQQDHLQSNIDNDDLKISQKSNQKSNEYFSLQILDSQLYLEHGNYQEGIKSLQAHDCSDFKEACAILEAQTQKCLRAGFEKKEKLIYIIKPSLIKHIKEFQPGLYFDHYQRDRDQFACKSQLQWNTPLSGKEKEEEVVFHSSARKDGDGKGLQSVQEFQIQIQVSKNGNASLQGNDLVQTDVQNEVQNEVKNEVQNEQQVGQIIDDGKEDLKENCDNGRQQEVQVIQREDDLGNSNRQEIDQGDNSQQELKEELKQEEGVLDPQNSQLSNLKIEVPNQNSSTKLDQPDLQDQLAITQKQESYQYSELHQSDNHHLNHSDLNQIYSSQSHSHPGFTQTYLPTSYPQGQTLKSSIILFDQNLSLLSPLASPPKESQPEAIQDSQPKALPQPDSLNQQTNPQATGQGINKNQVFPLGFPLQGYIPLMLCHSFNKDKHEPTGFFYSPKLDGVRCLWTGKVFYLRDGTVIEPPGFFAKQFPNSPLDGELVMDYDVTDEYDDGLDAVYGDNNGNEGKFDGEGSQFRLLQKLLKLEVYVKELEAGILKDTQEELSKKKKKGSGSNNSSKQKNKSNQISRLTEAQDGLNDNQPDQNKNKKSQKQQTPIQKTELEIKKVKLDSIKQSLVKTTESLWLRVTFVILDAPALNFSFKQRLIELQLFYKQYLSQYSQNPQQISKKAHLSLIPYHLCKSKDHCFKLLKSLPYLQQRHQLIEGFVFKSPNSLYERKRSWSVLKVKELQDAEGTVLKVKESKESRFVYMEVQVDRMSLPFEFQDHNDNDERKIGLKEGIVRLKHGVRVVNKGKKECREVKVRDVVSFKFSKIVEGEIRDAVFWRVKGF